MKERGSVTLGVLIGISLLVLIILLGVAFFVFYKNTQQTTTYDDSQSTPRDIIGESTVTNTTDSQTTPEPQDIVCETDSYNCGDFTTCEEVMDVFNSCPTDINRLDTNNDGIPCESLCP